MKHNNRVPNLATVLYLTLAVSLPLSASGQECHSPCSLPRPSASLSYSGDNGGCTTNDERNFVCQPNLVTAPFGVWTVVKILDRWQALSAVAEKSGIRSRFKIGMAAVRHLMIPSVPGKYFPEGQSLMEACQAIERCSLSSTQPQLNSTQVQAYLQAFTERLRQVWFKDDSCVAHYMLFYLHRGVFVHNEQVSTAPQLIIAAGGFTVAESDQEFVETSLWRIKKTAETCLSKKQDSGEVFAQVLLSLQKLRETYAERTRHRVPMWAWYVFGGCGLLSIIAVLTNTILTRQERMFKSGGSGTAAAGRWHAGGMISAMTTKRSAKAADV